MSRDRPQSAPTAPDAAADPPPEPDRIDRLFGSRRFLRLWLAMVTSALGDWLGFLAITAMAARVGGLGGVGAVFAARIAPGLFFASLAGVVVDRWDRRRVMIVCDVGRAAVLLCMPFVNSAFGLVLAALALELFTLAWQPAKEASVPHLVPARSLTTANSLSVVAAYGTFPVGAALFALLAVAAEGLGGFAWARALRLDQEGLALWVDALTFLVAAAVISRLGLPGRRPRVPVAPGVRAGLASLLVELRDGWRFLARSPVVRAVNVGLATGLIGGGMLIPLGNRFLAEVIGAGNSGYGLALFGLGVGMAVGVVAVSAAQSRIPRARTFSLAVMLAGAFLFGATSSSSLAPAVLLLVGLGVCAGTAYVLGFTLLHEHVDDDYRGRIFSTLNTSVRVCLLIAMVGAPLLAASLDVVAGDLVDRRVAVLGLEVFVPGIRLTMWLAASIMVAAGLLAARQLRAVGDGPGPGAALAEGVGPVRTEGRAP